MPIPPQGNIPVLHATRHQDTGVDEISVADLAGLLADDQHVLDAEVLLVAAALVHKNRHDPEDGADALDAAAPGAISEAANAEGSSHSFARADHNHQHTAALHENGGGAEISVTALLGLLADDQHVLNAEVLAIAAALLHASRHVPGGGDPMRWTANKLLKGAGAGADPTEIDVPAGVTFTELNGNDTSAQLAFASTWEDYDLSAIIGAGAVAVLIAIRVMASSENVGVRKNGTALNRINNVVSDAASPYWGFSIIAECDVNRIIEIYSTEVATRFSVLGYWS